MESLRKAQEKLAGARHRRRGCRRAVESPEGERGRRLSGRVALILQTPCLEGRAAHVDSEARGGRTREGDKIVDVFVVKEASTRGCRRALRLTPIDVA